MPQRGGPYYGPPPGYRPTKQSNSGMIAGLSVAGALVLVLGIVGAIALVNNSQRSTDVAYKGPQETSSVEHTTTTDPYPETTEPTETQDTTEPTETAESTAPETGYSSHSQRTGRTSESGPKPVHKLGNNPLFTDVGLPNVSCGLARWHSSPRGARAFFRSATHCLDKAWKSALHRAGLPFRSPKLEVPPSGTGSSPCSSTGESFAAYYCPNNETIYMPYQKIQVNRYGAHPGVYLALYAHEYGHHVQHLSGVMGAVADKQYDAGGYDSDTGLALQRKLELQAQCFSGMFVTTARGDVDRQLTSEAYNSQDQRGDDNGRNKLRSHGTSAHYQGWWKQGFTKNRTYQCNTWKANSGTVT